MMKEIYKQIEQEGINISKKMVNYMKKKLYTSYNEYEDMTRTMEFEIVDDIPSVGDWCGKGKS